MTPTHVYPTGVELLEQGARTTEVLYIDSGLIKLQRTHPNGRETILALAFPGEWAGTAEATIDIPSPATAITCTPSRIARMPASEFRERIAHDRDFSNSVHRMNAAQLCRQMEWIGKHALLTSEQRLRHVMRQLINELHLQPSHAGIRFRLPLRHWELARLVGITPEHLSRLLAQLKRTGIILRDDKGGIIVTNLQRLSEDPDPGEEPLAPAKTSMHLI
jgi:CRP/FNR family transcriptional regulator